MGYESRVIVVDRNEHLRPVGKCKKTQSGKNMQHYQMLLEKAVEAVVGKQQEQGVQTLFQRGGIRLAGDTDRRVDDFEVVAFVALMEAK